MLDALEEAQEMMHIKQSELPPLAMKYRQRLCSKYAMCMEVILTAFAHYCEVIRGNTRSGDVAYQADTEAIQFLTQNRSCAGLCVLEDHHVGPCVDTDGSKFDDMGSYLEEEPREPKDRQWKQLRE